LIRLDDPALVAGEYADDSRLRRRAAAFTGVGSTEDARVRIVAEVAAAQPERVLEVGCGWGELADWIARDAGAEVIATDLSSHMVELARERGIAARIADVQDLPFTDGEFDVAVAAWMLYHVQDIDRGLGELARVLQPGGHLVALTNSKRHCEELFDLIAYPQERREWVFNAENGEEALRRHFGAVERRELVAVATVSDRATLVAYQRSMSMDTQPVPLDVPLPFRVHARAVVFVAAT
jgi:SAM-dependent methyltransferase